MRELVEGWRQRLENELSGFADRGISPIVECDGTTLSAQWITRGKERIELFGLSPEGSLLWIDGPTKDATYKDFLASDGMSDFGQVALAMTRAIPRHSPFVANDATVETSQRDTYSASATPSEVARLAASALQGAEGRTELFFLKGDPGAGKTTALREATAAQAERYLAGDTNFLFFYVSAQGRELSNLRDAFSGELQDLRAAFTRDAIPTLARAGLLIPVIDGFDELLGTAGYSGAFSSLQNLLVELNGLGAIVVSARSAFYDLEFLGRSSSPANQADLSVTTVSLRPWSDEQLEEYLGLGSDGSATALLERLPDGDRELLKRPFFASEFLKIAADTSGSSAVPDLLEHLIEAYIAREAGKIVDSNGDPVLPTEGHRFLSELAASEMWESEVRQLSGGDLATVTELVAEQFGLGADEAKQLTAKASSYAGFRTGGLNSGEDFAFEHEVYFDYFLASSVQRMLIDDRLDDLKLFFDRGVVAETVITTALRRGAAQMPPIPTELLTCPTGVRYSNRRRNLGTLVTAFAREVSPLRDAQVSGLEFMDITLGSAEFINIEFGDCTFLSVDMSGTLFKNCSAYTSSFNALKLDNASHIDISGLRPGQNLGSLHHPEPGDIYAPEDVKEVLSRLGAPDDTASAHDPVYSDRAMVLIKLLQRAARAFRRTNILYEADEPRQLFKNEHWPDLKDLLVKHEVVSQETRDASGPRQIALRLRVTVDQLLTGQTSAKSASGPVAEFWADLRRLT